jgi:hypothetical protein
VTVFRRRSSGAPTVLDNDPAPAPATAPTPARQAGKGRPTPKRSEAERKRRQPYTAAPATKADRRAATVKDRTHRRAEQQRRIAAMKRGEEWALPAKERGPLRALARDYLDSRRLVLSEYVLFFIFGLLIILLFTHAAKNSVFVLDIEFGVVALVIGESTYHAYRIGRLAKQRLPGTSVRGLTWYIAKRSIRLRSTRIPPPRVGRGEAF